MDFFTLAKNSIFNELPFALLVLALGWLINEVQDIISAKNWERRLKDKTQAAIESIYEAEKALPGKGRGAERLVFAVKAFMRRCKIKDYKTAEKEILSAFPFTKLSE